LPAGVDIKPRGSPAQAFSAFRSGPGPAADRSDRRIRAAASADLGGTPRER
jgi:hypothetical protein